MANAKMIQYLQDRFGLSKVQASVIYFKLEEHFTKEGKGNQRNLNESLEVP
jgi:hypothetical protein